MGKTDKTSAALMWINAVWNTHTVIHVFMHEFSHLVYAMVVYFYFTYVKGLDVNLPIMKIVTNDDDQVAAGAVIFPLALNNTFLHVLFILLATSPLQLYLGILYYLHVTQSYGLEFYILVSTPYWFLSESDIIDTYCGFLLLFRRMTWEEYLEK